MPLTGGLVRHEARERVAEALEELGRLREAMRWSAGDAFARLSGCQLMPTTTWLPKSE